MNNTSPSHSFTFFREGDFCPFFPPWPNANFQYLTLYFTLDLICIISISQILSPQKAIRLMITHLSIRVITYGYALRTIYSHSG